MRMLYIFITGLIAFSLFYTCKTINKSGPIPTQNQNLIYLKAGRCYGKCQVYQLKITISGLVEFIPEKNFAKLEKSTMQLAPEKLVDLMQLIDSTGLNALESAYLSTAKDLQKFEIIYQDKMIRFHKMKAPPGLLNLLNYLQKLIAEQN